MGYLIVLSITTVSPARRSDSNRRRMYLFIFIFGLGACAVSRLSVPWLFGLVLASWFPWLLGFSVSRLLGHSTSCSFACFVWFVGFLVSLAFRSLGLLAFRLLIASCIILYNVILNDMNIIYIYIIIFLTCI